MLLQLGEIKKRLWEASGIRKKLHAFCGSCLNRNASQPLRGRRALDSSHVGVSPAAEHRQQVDKRIFHIALAMESVCTALRAWCGEVPCVGKHV